MGPIRTELIRDADALEALEEPWWDLWRRSAMATPFQSPAWLVPWWRHFHPGDLHAIAAWEDGRLGGLAPFYLETGPLGRRLLPVGISLSDYGDVLVDPTCAERAGAALVAGMAREGGWDSWELEELPPGAAALSLPVPAGCEETVEEHQSACPTLVLPEGVHDLAAVLPAKKRRKLNLARNRAGRRGGVTMERAVSGGEGAVLDVLLRLHGARWKARGEGGLAADERVPPFQRDAAPRLLAAGLLRLYALSIGGEPAAAYFGLLHRGRAYAYFTGFDPRFAFESPGSLLFAGAWQDALDEGAREIHLLRGREPYKYGWGATDRWNRKRSFHRRGGEARPGAAGALAG